jgi:hypothetical protein
MQDNDMIYMRDITETSLPLQGPMMMNLFIIRMWRTEFANWSPGIYYNQQRVR